MLSLSPARLLAHAEPDAAGALGDCASALAPKVAATTAALAAMVANLVSRLLVIPCCSSSSAVSRRVASRSGHAIPTLLCRTLDREGFVGWLPVTDRSHPPGPADDRGRVGVFGAPRGSRRERPAPSVFDATVARCPSPSAPS